ncbi:actin-related protein, ARP6 class [Tothia fuscella]|uniref:Actin-related protein, ARP6 class n=1 Tax=Tothia fuscella TaxID=1048955 RepID=A0A9P4NK20_9PEZI|nr:actin-related protein, ARP6 class [Tothia fuscella]
MPGQAKSVSNAGIRENTLVVDNGGYSIKAGFVTKVPNPHDCHIVPNCIARDSDRKTWIGSQLDQCKDFGHMSFRRPVDRGYVVNWEGERAIWGHSLFSENSPLQCDPHMTNLVLTEAPNCPQPLQTFCDQIIFEEFEFASCCRLIGSALNAYNELDTLFGNPNKAQDPQITPAECLLVIDSGYSHTTITPLIRGRPVQSAIRRIDIAGKFLTNYLKEQLSDQIIVLDETHAVDELKEQVCFVSDDFARDLDRTWMSGGQSHRPPDLSLVLDYVLPNYETVFKGYSRQHDPAAAIQRRLRAAKGLKREDDDNELVTIGTLRFSPPELLFNPADLGMKEAGLPSAIVKCVEAMPVGLRPAMLANILLVGGSVKFPGFEDRLLRDLRQLVPSEYPVRIALPDDPVKSTWLGGARMANNPEVLKRLLVTREDYLEHGANWTLRRFANFGG